MIKVGLTGGIGSGKSTVSNILRAENIPIIDADIIAREVLELYPEIIDKIKNDFGFEFIDENEKLKRREFGNYIFRNKTQRENYEKIIMPFIKREIFKRLDQYNELGEEICIVDAPTLIEHSIHEEMDANILVWVSREIQIDRVIKRDLLEEHQVLDRINSQMTLEEKKPKVDFIIDNSGELKNTIVQISKILTAIKNIREEQ